MIKLPLNPKTELFKWGPSPLRYYYLDFILMMGGGWFARIYPNHPWPKSVVIFVDKKGIWLNEFSALRKQGNKVFSDFFLNQSREKKLRKEYDRALFKLQKIEQRLDRVNIKNLSNLELGDWLNELHEHIYNFIAHGLIPELANYGPTETLKEKLRLLVKSKDLNSVMEILTAPVESSFYKVEEIRLSRAKNIKAHAQKYRWIKNSYSRVLDVNEHYFQQRQKKLSKNVAAKEKQRLRQARQAKKALARKLKLPTDIIKYASKISECIAWQDNRKGHIFEYLRYKDMLLVEISRRRHKSKDKLLNLDFRELNRLAAGEDLRNLINKREHGFAFVFDKEIVELNSTISRKLLSLYSLEKVKKNQTSIKGIVASAGQVRGRVRILHNPYQLSRLKAGEVLVATMTTPEYIFAMRRASAIVTDNGGFTSHAAIVSRELGKPCIVGTKVATQLLKDGDEVQVDGKSGVVKLINKA